MIKTSFINFGAFKKTLRGFGNDDVIKASRDAYVKGTRRVHKKAQSNAPVGKTGRLKRNIRWIGEANRKAGKGSIMNYTVYSNSIQDMVLTNGIPNRTLTPQEATNRSRTYKGSKHRLRAGFNYTRKRQLTKKGNVSKKQPIGKDGRPWAFGYRDPNPFMTKGQDFNKTLDKMAEETANNIFKEFDKKFSAMAK